jgi:hypothetical protein
MKIAHARNKINFHKEFKDRCDKEIISTKKINQLKLN